MKLYNKDFNNRYRLIAKKYNVLMQDYTDNNVYTFIHCNDKNISTYDLPTFTNDTFITSTITLYNDFTINTQNWYTVCNIETNKCVVKNDVIAETGSAITNTTHNSNYISTKYYVDWMKNHTYKQLVTRVATVSSKLGHIKTSSEDSDFILIAYNLYLKEYADKWYIDVTKGDDNTRYENQFGVDMHNIETYKTCGFIAISGGGKIYPMQGRGISYNYIGFRKKYIIEIEDKELKINK